MNITLMERVYKGNKYVLYINGFVGAISEHSMIDTAIKILTHLKYNITEINCIMQLTDNVPNNEVDYWHEGKKKSSVIIEQSSIMDSNYLSYYKFNLEVNGKIFKTHEKIGEEISEVLRKMGHPCKFINIKDEIVDYHTPERA